MRRLGLIAILAVLAVAGAGDVPVEEVPPVPPGLVAVVNGTATVDTLYESQFCGGVAVAPARVVTVAHCLTGRTPSNIAVAFGGTDLCGGGGMIIYAVREIRPSPSNAELVEMILTDPIAGPFPDVSKGGATGTLSVHGWGKTTGTGSLACGAKTLSLTPIPVVECQSLSASGRSAEDPDVFCARPARGSGNTCQGDSGSPVYDTSNTVVGCVLGGVGCGTGDDGLYALP